MTSSLLPGRPGDALPIFLDLVGQALSQFFPISLPLALVHLGEFLLFAKQCSQGRPAGGRLALPTAHSSWCPGE